MIYNVGDRVIYITEDEIELKATVLKIRENIQFVPIEFDAGEEHPGHDCGGLCSTRRGWWALPSSLKLIGKESRQKRGPKIIKYEEGYI